MARFPSKQSASGAITAAFKDIAANPSQLCCLCLVIPQVWLWILLRAIGSVPSATTLGFYAAEGAALLVMFLLFLKAPRERRFSPGVSAAFVACMTCAPARLYFGGGVWGLPAAVGGEALGGVGLSWAYAAYFRASARLGLRRAVRGLLASFILVPLVRLPFDLLPVAAACVVAFPLPLLYARALRRFAELPVPGPEAREAMASFGPGIKEVPLVVELVAFGLAMGIFRVSADGIQDDPSYVLLNLVIKVAFPLLALLAVERFWDRIGVGSLCQAALVLVALLMVGAVNLKGAAAASFVLFDYARYVMVILIFLALAALMRRTDLHPYALFGVGMGSYTAALAVGMGVSALLGLGSELSELVALDVLCVLMVVTVAVGKGGSPTDRALFSDGSPELAPAQSLEEVDERCTAVAERYGLAKREQETMALIAKGRSKRYIAEQLCLSENTVRGYAKTLYAKLGVHSRQELLDLLGVE